MTEHSFWVVVVVVVVMGFRRGCTHARAHTRALGALYTLVMPAFVTRAFPCARAHAHAHLQARVQARRYAAGPVSMERSLQTGVSTQGRHALLVPLVRSREVRA